MDQIAVFNFANLDGIERMMVGDCLVVSLDVLPSPTLDGNGFFRFGFP